MGVVILGNTVKKIILTFWKGSQGESNQKSTNKAVDEFVYVGWFDPLADFLYVPKNDTLLRICWGYS